MLYVTFLDSLTEYHHFIAAADRSGLKTESHNNQLTDCLWNISITMQLLFPRHNQCNQTVNK